MGAVVHLLVEMTAVRPSLRLETNRIISRGAWFIVGQEECDKVKMNTTKCFRLMIVSIHIAKVQICKTL